MVGSSRRSAARLMRLFRSPRRPPLCLALESVCLGALLAVAPAGSAQAQSYQTVGEGLTVGRFVLYPSLSLEYTRDSNIFYTPSDLPGTGATASGIVVARPRILADLPFGQSRIRLAYAPFYRDYTNESFQGSSRLNQAFDVEGLIRSGGALTIGIRDHFVRGTVSLQEQGDRSGLTFGLGRYATHTPQMEIGVNSGGRQGFSLIPSYSRSSFTGISESVRYGYTTRKLEGRYNYRVSEASTLYGYYGVERTTQNQAGFEDLGIHSRSFGLGIRRMVNEKVVTLMSVGYQALDFQGGGGQNFGGLIVVCAVPVHAHGHALDERWPLTGPGPVHRPLGGFVHGDRVGPVDLFPRNAVADRLVHQLATGELP